MAFTRYNKRSVFTNRSYNYMFSDILRKRDLRAIKQFDSAQLAYPTAAQVQQLNLKRVVWTVGEKYFKLAAAHYGDPAYWWVIAWFNKQPLEANIKAGDIVHIPLPLELILDFLNIT